MLPLRILASLAAISLLAGCAGGAGFGGPFRLIQPQPVSVTRASIMVEPGVHWNRVPRGTWDISYEENWTLNGPLLDNLTFIGGLPDDRPIVRQRRREDRQVPNFRASMSPPELASMIESFYRIRAGSVRFEMTGLRPRTFLGHPGFQFDYDHLGGNEVERRGRAVGAVIGDRFYLALWDAAKMHYFQAGLPEFERIVESARLR